VDQTRISRLGQVKVYTGKCFRAFSNDKGWKAFISSIIILIIISWVAGRDMFHTLYETRSGAFALVCACIWIGIFNSVQSICRERAIIKREHRTGLHISSYITAHMLYEMVLCLVQALISVVILFVMRDPPIHGIITSSLIEFFITFFLVIFAADMLGILISSVVKNETQAMTVMPFVLILQLVMSGVIFALDDVASLISNITISKWGVNAIGSIANLNAMPDTLVISNFNRDDFASVPGNLYRTWVILALFALSYIVISTVILKIFIDKDKR